MELKINKLISPFNHNQGTISRIKYIAIHYCGAVGSAEANARYFYGGNRNASAHYFVDEKDIWQSVEDADIAWHVGANKYLHPECRNQNSLGIEMCCKTTGDPSKADANWYFEDKTVERTIALTRYLMKKYEIDADHVVRHYDVTGKVCPAPYVYNTGKHTWDQFKKAIGGGAVPTPAENNEKDIWDYLKAKGLNDYAVAGVMGNLQAESGLRPNNLQNTYEKKLGMNDEQYTAAVDIGAYTNFVHDSAGYGLAQWTYWSRKQGLLDYCKSINASIANLNAQLDWLWKEFTARPSLMNKLRSATSVKEASNAVLHEYEAPSDQSAAVEDSRASLGVGFYNKYAKITPIEGQFKVRVTTDSLNIRTGPGTNYPTTGEYTGKGVFTILEVKSGQGSVKGWGRLKSGVGWISLDYAERI